MNLSKGSMIVLVILAILAIIFALTSHFGAAILTLCALFVVSNFVRGKSLTKDGYPKAAKWMYGLSILFAIFFVILAVVLLIF